MSVKIDRKMAQAFLMEAHVSELKFGQTELLFETERGNKLKIIVNAEAGYDDTLKADHFIYELLSYGES